MTTTRSSAPTLHLRLRQTPKPDAQSGRGGQVAKTLRTRVDRFNAQVPGQGQGLRSSKLRVKRNRAGQAMVSVSGVPLEAFEAYAAEIMRQIAASAAGDAEPPAEG